MNVWKTQMSQLFSFPTGLDPIFHHLFLPTFRMSSGTNTWLFGRSRSLSCPWPCRDYFCTSFPHGPQICVHWWGKAPLYKGTLWKLNTVAWPSRNKLKQLTQSMDAVDILLNPFKVPLKSFKCDFLVWSRYMALQWFLGILWKLDLFESLRSFVPWSTDLAFQDGNPEDAAHWLKRDMWVACVAWRSSG